MSVETSPIFFFIPGAWHSPDTFNAVRAVLAQRGHESTAVALPSVGSDKPFNVGLHADIAHVHHALRALAKMGRKIVLIMHSYGGMVGSGALEGLGYAQRQQKDLSGGVIMAVWMASFVTPKGKCLFDMLGNQWLPWMMFTDPDDGYCYSSQQEAIFYHDIPSEEQATAIAQLRPHSKLAFLEPATYEPWRDMPCMYLFCDHDVAIPLSVQEQFAQTLGDPVTYHMSASHSPFLSQPEELAQRLELALEQGLAKLGSERSD